MDKERDFHSGGWVEQQPSWPHGREEESLWKRQDATQQRKQNYLTPTALWFAQREMTLVFVWAGAVATHQVGTVERGPRGPCELRVHS